MPFIYTYPSAPWWCQTKIMLQITFTPCPPPATIHVPFGSMAAPRSASRSLTVAASSDTAGAAQCLCAWKPEAQTGEQVVSWSHWTAISDGFVASGNSSSRMCKLFFLVVYGHEGSACLFLRRTEKLLQWTCPSQCHGCPSPAPRPELSRGAPHLVLPHFPRKGAAGS